MKNIIDPLQWRYAVKKYDSDKKVSENEIEQLRTAIQLAPSAHGLQPYQVLFIEDESVRKELLAASYNQSQVTDASHFVVFAVETFLEEAYIDSYFENITNTRKIPLEGSLLHHKNSVTGSLNRMSSEEKRNWATHQAYLALGFLLFAAAELGIDANPMEGFIPAEYNKILNLDEMRLSAVVIAGIGYRHEGDFFQHFAKVRKPAADLFITI